MSFILRKRTHLTYYEPEEPSFDQYLYCERCADFVYDYCALHGPLLVVPDNKVSMKTDHPSPVPRAALTIPHVFLHLAPSIIPGAGLGVFSTLTLPRDVRFGPYCGRRTHNVDSSYSWQIYDRNNRRSHVLDAADCDRSNWMRYVNCARHWKEQNLVAYQYKGELYYRTIKIIPRYTELMVFYGSEFANALHIDLSKYNSAKYYAEIISTPSKPLRHNEDDILEDYLNAEHFHIIDENVDDDGSNKMSSVANKNTNIHSTETNNSLKEIARDENKQDCKENASKPSYECESCQKTFSTSRNLKEHINRKHNTVWKYNCEYCLYRSNQIYPFKQHVGKHTNTFKFSCEKCSFKTNYGRNFRRHCIRHENHKENTLRSYSARNNFPSPKKCDICHFKTCSRKVFSTHMSKHKGNIYRCDKCSYGSHSKYNLSRHITRIGH